MEERHFTVVEVVGEDGDDEGGEQKEEMERGLFGREGRDVEGEGEVVFEDDGDDDDDEDVVVGELRKERRERGLVEGDVGADEERFIFVFGGCNGLLVNCDARFEETEINGKIGRHLYAAVIEGRIAGRE